MRSCMRGCLIRYFPPRPGARLARQASAVCVPMSLTPLLQELIDVPTSKQQGADSTGRPSRVEAPGFKILTPAEQRSLEHERQEQATADLQAAKIGVAATYFDVSSEAGDGKPRSRKLSL